MKSAVLAILAALVCLVTASPAVRQSDKTILDIVSEGAGAFDANTEDFDVLAKLISDSGLTSTLNDTGAKFTVFAPNDAAFIQTAKDFGYKGSEESGAYAALAKLLGASGTKAPDVVKQVLQYHLAPTKLASADILKSKSIVTVNGKSITRDDQKPLELIDIAKKYPNPKLINAKLDQEASNGVIHQIDRVLLPVDIPANAGAGAGASTGSASSSAEPDASAESSSDSKDGDGACFPVSSSVHLADGSDILISSLKAGHHVKVTSSGVSTSKVYFFSHRQFVGMHEFVRITSAGKHVITLTPNHYIYANGRRMAADNVKVGDKLETLDGVSAVINVERVTEKGLVAPHTLHGDLVVNRVLVSTYTRALHPNVAHALLAPVRALVHMGVSDEPLGSLLYDGAGRLVQFVPKGPSIF